MTIEERILRTTNMSEYDIRKHLKNGVFAYSNYDEFKANCLAGMIDEEEIPAMWESLDTYEIDGTTYRLDFVL